MRFVRKLHKWLSLLIGLQVLLWLASGLGMSLLDPQKVSGAAWKTHDGPLTAAQIPEGSVLDVAELPAELMATATRVTLRAVGGSWAYRVSHEEGTHWLDAASGNPLNANRDEVIQTALADYAGTGSIESITRGTAPDLETRNHAGPYWRVDFNDAMRTSIYVSAAHGGILERRNRYWRLFDFFWMLHIMDYAERTDFNHPIIVISALLSAWIGLSGFLLLFVSFRRR